MRCLLPPSIPCGADKKADGHPPCLLWGLAPGAVLLASWVTPPEDSNGSLLRMCGSCMGRLVNTLTARNVAFKISVVYSERLRNKIYLQ